MPSLPYVSFDPSPLASPQRPSSPHWGPDAQLWATAASRASTSAGCHLRLPCWIHSQRGDSGGKACCLFNVWRIWRDVLFLILDVNNLRHLSFSSCLVSSSSFSILLAFSRNFTLVCWCFLLCVCLLVLISVLYFSSSFPWVSLVF